MNNKQRILALAVVFGICMVLAESMYAQPDPRVCARNMCSDMRACSTYVPQPTPQYEKTDKPSGSRSNLVEKQKGGSDAQGLSGTCRFVAYMGYLGCDGGQQGGVVKPNDNTSTGNMVKTTVTSPKK